MFGPAFRSEAVAPLACISEGWAIIREQYWLFVLITGLAILIGGAVPIVLTGPTYCGIFLCCFARQRGERVSLELFFRGFDYFVESLIASLCIMAIAMVIMLPFFLLLFAGMFGAQFAAAQAEQPEIMLYVMAGVLLLMVPMMILATLTWVLLLLAYPLIVEHRLKALDALRLALDGALANLGGLIVLDLLLTALMLVAALCCYLPIFLVMPLYFAALAAAYRRIFPAPAA